MDKKSDAQVTVNHPQPLFEQAVAPHGILKQRDTVDDGFDGVV